MAWMVQQLSVVHSIESVWRFEVSDTEVINGIPYMWVILCPLVGERLVPPARARKRSDVTRGHMWAINGITKCI